MEFGGNDNGGVHGKIRIPPYLTVDDIIMGPPETLYHLNKSSNAMTEDTELNFHEEDHFMPVANIIRIMRKVLPQNAKISDEAKQAIQECVTAFIGIITGEANDRCQQEQRKSITADDLLWAMKELGFHDYIEPLMVYLSRFRKIEGGKRGSIRGDPLVKRVDRGPKALPGHEPTTFHPVAAPYGYLGAFPVNGFVEDQAGGAGPSHASTVGGEPNPPREE